MRILLAIHDAYTDHTSGAAHSMRILMQWMAQAGHDVRVLGTARFDAKPPARSSIISRSTAFPRGATLLRNDFSSR